MIISVKKTRIFRDAPSVRESLRRMKDVVESVQWYRDQARLAAPVRPNEASLSIQRWILVLSLHWASQERSNQREYRICACTLLPFCIKCRQRRAALARFQTRALSRGYWELDILAFYRFNVRQKMHLKRLSVCVRLLTVNAIQWLASSLSTRMKPRTTTMSSVSCFTPSRRWSRTKIYSLCILTLMTSAFTVFCPRSMFSSSESPPSLMPLVKSKKTSHVRSGASIPYALCIYCCSYRQCFIHRRGPCIVLWRCPPRVTICFSLIKSLDVFVPSLGYLFIRIAQCVSPLPCSSRPWQSKNFNLVFLSSEFIPLFDFQYWQ